MLESGPAKRPDFIEKTCQNWGQLDGEFCGFYGTVSEIS
jgi:hypothetical protein